MKKYFFLSFFLLFLMVIPPAEARVYLDINAPTFVQIPIVLPKWKTVNKTPPTLTAKVYDILTNDLTLAGFFKVIDHSRLPSPLKEREGIPNPASLREWTSNGGEILLAGGALLHSHSNLILKFHLFDLVEQKHLAGKQYEGPSQLLRKMAHRIADEVILQHKGGKGVHNTKNALASIQ